MAHFGSKRIHVTQGHLIARDLDEIYPIPVPSNPETEKLDRHFKISLIGVESL